ncbi:cupin domain-containing protein [Actinosynnema sp. NPDC059335]|uniref:cupin domain-containing protein n=1 Tax=Actinosynnema sp. NPDC059335 TaxID=3346804 RepID=UPI00366ABD79
MSFTPDQLKTAVHVPPGAGPSRWVFGDRYTLKSGLHNTGPAFGLVEAVVPAGGGPPKHVHYHEDELFYVIDGRLELFTGEEAVIAEPGAFIYVPRGVTHSFTNAFTDDCRMLLMFLPAGKERFFLEMGVSADDGAPPPPPEQYAIDRENAIRLAPKYGERYV